MNESSVEPDSQGSSTISNKSVDFILRLRDWAAAHWIRSAAIGLFLLGLSAGTVAAWLYLANLTVKADLITVDLALQALDEQDLVRAESLALRLRGSHSLQTNEAGSPLYVLGAVKAAQADSHWSPERGRDEYLVAARYLEESRALGFPPGREASAQFLLGRCLLSGNELEAGIQALEEAVNLAAPPAIEIHRLLSEANLAAPSPRLKEALRHNAAVLESTELTAEQRADTELTRAQILIGLKQFDTARSVLGSIAAQGPRLSKRELLEGWLLLEQARQTHVAGAQNGLDASELLAQAEAKFLAAQSLDRLATDVSRQSMYLHADAALEIGDIDRAMKLFGDTRRLHPETPEGIAASLREAELLRQRNDYESALNAYRRTLQALNAFGPYRNPWLPLVEFRRRMDECHQGLIAARQFSTAIAILEDIVPLFDEERQLSLRGEALEEWGKSLLLEASNEAPHKDLLREGRKHLREAGVCFHQLAKSRSAGRRFTDDLWRSAEDFLLGQSYTRAAEILNLYLNNEPQRRNAQALLRLGQCHLALGKVDESIAALEECIEFQPYDAAVYQARIDCARAYRAKQDRARAEQLLLENITGGALTPLSPEWRLSQFELGSLLHEDGRYTEAVERLEEAVERYPDDSQARLARYLIAESYRHAAAEPLDALAEAKTIGEREHLRTAIESLLGNSLRFYGEVQREVAAAGESSEVDRAMRRNCYLLQGSVLFDLQRYKEAVESYSNVATLYQNEPFVLETLVQIAHCWNRLNDDAKAHGQIEQAKLFLDRLPENADFVGSTNLTRTEWQALLNEMSSWWRPKTL